MKTAVFSSTPAVAVRDARGLSVREIQYHRHPDTPVVTDTRITRHQHDIRGALAQSSSPRLYDLMQVDSSVKPDFVYVTALAGHILCTRSVDAGTTLTLSDAAGRPARAVSATGTVRRWQYEPATLQGRVLNVTEQAAGDAARITERFVWAGHSVAEQNLNLAGQNVRHDDTAGYVQLNSLALSGAILSQSRQLLTGETFVTQTTADATGTVLTTTDAMDNTQRVAYDIAGQLKGSWLTLTGGAEQVIVTSLTYSAAGQKLREEHGNGVITTWSYEPQAQRLTGIKTERLLGHSAGAKVLQDLRYEYDAVGNVLKVSNDAEATQFWRNQKVVPENTYRYDSLYQLVSATGREMASAGQQNSDLPAFVSFDNASYTNYTRTYTYDRGSNLTQIRHSAPASGNNHTTTMTVSHRSNRAVLSTFTTDPTQVDALFTAGGEQKQLMPGQHLTWTPRGELMQVTRDGQSSDRESYQYDAGSQRVVKTSLQQSHTQRVVYLPGIELRTTANSSTQTENLQIITLGEAGRAQVRVLHWEAGKPAAIANDQIRYSYDNLIGSSGLEVDGSGNIISQEEYYPYGGTSVWTARSQTEADYKTIRYSGKERDATGLYYYGYRYYQPWAGRWLSADPAGTVDGLNLYRMVRNNPVTLRDIHGLMPEWVTGAILGGLISIAVFLPIILYVALVTERSLTAKYDMHIENKLKKFEESKRNTIQGIRNDFATSSAEEGEAERAISFFKKNAVHSSRHEFATLLSEKNGGLFFHFSYASKMDETIDIINSNNHVSKRLESIGSRWMRIKKKEISSDLKYQGGVSFRPFFAQSEWAGRLRKNIQTKKENIPVNLGPTKEKSPMSNGSKGYFIENPDFSEHYEGRDRNIIKKVIGDLSAGRHNNSLYKADYADEWLVDLPGFHGDSGRSRWRMAMTKNENKFFIRGVRDPH